MAIVNVFYRGLKDQLERKGFECIGEMGNDNDIKRRYTLRGNALRISKRELPFVELAAHRVYKTEEQTYGPRERSH